MPLYDKSIHILVIEDNPGDGLLIEDYLREELESAEIFFARTFIEARKFLTKNVFDVVLLDLALPDNSGEKLLRDIVQLTGQSPIIVLTGLENKTFGIKTLSLGASDFLLKQELNASHLSKSIVYSIERKKLANEVRNSEDKYKKMFTLSPSPMWVYEVDTFRILDVNRAAIQTYGYSREEFLELSIMTLRPEEDIHIVEEEIRNYVSNRSFVSYSHHFRHKTKEGKIIYVDIQSSAFDFDGRKSRLVLATDITEKLAAENALKLSETRFKSLVQDGSDLISILDPEANYKYVSPTTKAILGINADFFIGKNAFDFIHEDDQELVRQFFKKILSHDRLTVPPFRFRDSKNKWRWIETNVTNRMDDPAVQGIIANARDVTNDIENEIKLKESVARYNLVAKATKDVIWDWDLKQKVITWNEGIKTVFGYNKNQVDNDDTWWQTKVHPKDLDRVLSGINFHVENKILKWQDEYRFQCANGSYKYVFNRGFLVIDKKDEPIRMLGAMQDITRKKKEEQHLKLLESVITNATDGVMVTEAENIDEPGPKILFVNNAFVKMCGYSTSEIIGRSPRFLQGKNTDRTALDKLRKSLENGENCELEIINYKKNGEEYWVQMEIAPVSDSQGNLTHFISIQRDITERKLYIQAIEDQNTKLSEIAWLQSHIVRAPLARIMGLINFLNTDPSEEEKININIAGNIYSAANELDSILRKIVEKAEQVNISKSNEAESTDSGR